MRGQATEMTVKQEARLDGTAIFDGMDFDSISVLCDSPQRLIPPVDLYLSDLRVRHSQRLGQMLDGLPPSKVNSDLTLSLVSSDEIVQPAVK